MSLKTFGFAIFAAVLSLGDRRFSVYSPSTLRHRVEQRGHRPRRATGFTHSYAFGINNVGQAGGFSTFPNGTLFAIK